MSASELQYTPSEWGNKYHNLDHHEALGAGSAGPGKSLVLTMNPVAKVLIDHWRCTGEVTAEGVPESTKSLVRKHPMKWGMSPGWTLHLRRAIPMLEQTLARCHRIFPHIDPEVHYDQKKHIFTFKSGYRIQFGHCLNRNDWVQYDSQQYDEIDYDELVQFEEMQYHNVNSRLRSSDPVHSRMLRVRAMSNPVRIQDSNVAFEVNDPQWVRRRFVDPAPQGNTDIIAKMRSPYDGRLIVRKRIYVPATLYDNPDPVFVKQYEENLVDKPAHIRQAMLFGNWYVTAGSFYGEDWIENLHVIKPFRMPDDWVQFRMMDWGFKTNGACLWGAMDPDDNLYIHKELIFRYKTATEVAREIKEIEMELGLWEGGRSRITGPADTQLWEQRGESGKSKAEEMADVGVFWTPADKRSRARNAERILGRLRDHGDGTRQPGIVFFVTCRNIIKNLPGIQADIHNPEEPAKGGDDHSHDALGYGCAFASKGFKAIPMRGRGRGENVVHSGAVQSPSRRRFGYGL